MAKVAILGFGTVGSGVLEILCQNADLIQRRSGCPIDVKYILVRSMKPHPQAALFTQNIQTILNDTEVTLVVECIGGCGDAYRYVKAALELGKSVITSNKELVAQHGAQLLALAKQNNCAFLFEASVGGGTPILAPMHQSLVANQICSVQGIINGTTNFMLTKMAQQDMSFAQALKLAQQLGYAETHDPSDDVDGLDAARKIAILASLAFGKHIYPENIPTQGIGAVDLPDMQAARQLGCTIKLIAWANRRQDGTVTAGVQPMMVANSNQLAQVNDVYNAVLVQCDMVQRAMFLGPGAGKLATASAAVSDLVQAVQQGVQLHNSLYWQPSDYTGQSLASQRPATCYIRTKKLPASMLPQIYGAGELILDSDEDACYVVENITPQKRNQAAREIQALGGKVMAELCLLQE